MIKNKQKINKHKKKGVKNNNKHSESNFNTSKQRKQKCEQSQVYEDN